MNSGFQILLDINIRKIILFIFFLMLILGNIFSQSGMDNLFDRASYYLKNSKYKKAIEDFKNVITREKNSKNPDDSKISFSIAEIGYCYVKLGNYMKAYHQYKKAVPLLKKRKEERRNLVVCYLHLANIQKLFGRYSESLKLINRALEISIEINDVWRISECYQKKGELFIYFGKIEEALLFFDKAIKELGNKKALRHKSHIYRSIGDLYKKIKKYNRAFKYYNKSYKINLKYEERKYSQAKDLHLIGYLYYEQKKYSAAEKYYSKAFKLYENAQTKIDRAILESNLGKLYYKTKEYRKAEKHLLNAIEYFEKIYKKADENFKRSFLDKVLDAYQYLIYVYEKTDNIYGMVRITDAYHGKLLNIHLREKMNESNFDIFDFKNYLEKDTCILMYSNMNKKKKVIYLLSNNNIKVKIINKNKLIDKLINKYSEKLVRDFKNSSRMEFNLKKEEKEIYLQDNKNKFSKIISIYRNSLQNKKNIRELSGVIYKLLINPFENEMKKYKNIIIIPDGWLSFLPFETLLKENEYLIENYNIKYCNSLKTLNLLHKRKNYESKKIVGFGAAIYDIWRYNNQMEIYYKNILNYKEKNNQPFKELGFSEYSNLPYSLKEINLLKKNFKNVELYKGKKISKKIIKNLLKKDLKYEIIHFALHGDVSTVLPGKSSLVLSQFSDFKSDDNGFLTVDEISNMNIKAQFVNLSACETGLGEIFHSEGVVGLKEAFLQAGAQSVLATLWRIEDKATYNLMKNYYKKINVKTNNYCHVISDWKRDLIKDERYSHPYYWGSFVFWGK
ncbi:MAG TPA: CHAT domain-containing protein [Candidatus Mcinerneyibacterium sp.]|nr:CHAT domain-containing protein [Candidatus Mcinerneyibacterium sp.]